MLSSLTSRLALRASSTSALLATTTTGTAAAVRRYHEKVIDHYERPRNVGSLNKNDPTVGTGLVGAPACGDVMKLQIKVDESGKIVDARFKTFGCGSAIASSSLVTQMVQGLTLDEASQIKNNVIAKELSLPPVKLHCSMLAEDAIKAAIADFKKKRSAASAMPVPPPPSSGAAVTSSATA
ncbi:NifU-like N terminal domain-containing protein [Blastocladiella britannica]|nr:NifU-like N terminal domain-containing protein [Blastocladiella britannica]